MKSILLAVPLLLARFQLFAHNSLCNSVRWLCVAAVLIVGACGQLQEQDSTLRGYASRLTPVISYAVAVQRPTIGCGAWERETKAALCTVLGEAEWQKFRTDSSTVVLSIVLRRLPGQKNVGTPKSVSMIRAANLKSIQKRRFERIFIRRVSQHAYELAQGSGPVVSTASITVLFIPKRYESCPTCF